MSLSYPHYQVQCDEPDCRNYMCFPLGGTGVPGVYQRTVESAASAYELHGGEILPDGKHRCPDCRKKLGTAKSLSPADYRRIFDTPRLNLLYPLYAVIDRARDYRVMEQDGTPRLWRGKALQDKASALDNSLDVYDGNIP